MNPITIESARRAVARMGLMKYFPSDPETRSELMLIIFDICEFEEQSDWLSRRMIELYGEWPGVKEMRAAFCSKYRPKDGREEYSGIYLDGIPSEKDLETSMHARLPSGVISEDHQLREMVNDVAKQLPQMPRLRRGDYRERAPVEGELRHKESRKELPAEKELRGQDPEDV